MAAALNSGIRKFIPGIAWFFIVLILICLPGSDIPSVDDWFDLLYLDKFVHFLIFGILAYLFMRPIGMSDITRKSKVYLFMAVVVAVSAWGLGTEYIQKHFITGRSFELTDWIADSAGALAAMLISRRFLRIID